jgi:hypothetical protein
MTFREGARARLKSGHCGGTATAGSFVLLIFTSVYQSWARWKHCHLKESSTYYTNRSDETDTRCWSCRSRTFLPFPLSLVNRKVMARPHNSSCLDVRVRADQSPGFFDPRTSHQNLGCQTPSQTIIIISVLIDDESTTNNNNELINRRSFLLFHHFNNRE